MIHDSTKSAHRGGPQVQADGELKLLRGDEVAEILNVSKSYVYQLLATGAIPVVRLGRAVRVRQGDLENFIKASLDGAGPDKPGRLISDVSSRRQDYE